MTEEHDPMKTLSELMGFIENLSVLTDAAVSYRKQLEAQGYSPTMAEVIASELHLMMLRKTFGAVV